MVFFEQEQFKDVNCHFVNSYLFWPQSAFFCLVLEEKFRDGASVMFMKRRSNGKIAIIKKKII